MQGKRSRILMIFIALILAVGAISSYPLPSATAETPKPHLVLDIRPGPESSSPRDLTRVGGRLFLSGRDGVHGRELWLSTGTASGTHLVANIVSGGSSDPSPIIAYRGRAYFDAYGPSSSPPDRLWQSDGTAAGTVPFDHVYQIAWMGRAGGKLYISSWGPNPRMQHLLYRTDGTPAGTYVVQRNLPDEFTSVRGTLFFKGNPLWKSDGTPTGTVRVRSWPGGDDTYLDWLTAVGHKLFFTVDKVNSIGEELWVSDGTRAGTHLVKDIRPGRRGSNPNALTNAGGTLYFSANDGVHGRELWKSDGTRTGTVKFRDIVRGGNGSHPFRLTGCGRRLYFAATRPATGREFWRSNGTAASTRRVRDIRPGVRGSDPKHFTCTATGVAFSATDGVHGRELWTSDGTRAGTRLHDISRPSDSNPSRGVLVGKTMYFAASDPIHGRELWSLVTG